MHAHPGWHLLGQFPLGDPDGVGSWLLHHNGVAVLLELPPGLTVDIVSNALSELGCALLAVTASHSHEDHLDLPLWREMVRAFPKTNFIVPHRVTSDRRIDIAGDSLWLVPAPKHSPDDVVAIFRGVAMTGDIELKTLGSVNREVPRSIKRRSFEHLAAFTDRTGYHIHSTTSAHLNDHRIGVNWRELFTA